MISKLKNSLNLFIKIEILSLIILSIILVLANSANAAFLNTNAINDMGKSANSVGAAGYETGGTKNDVLLVVQSAINIFLSVIGIVLLIYIIYAGYNWMTAQGQEEKVEKAKDTLKRAIIGVIIIVAAYAISIFVVDRLSQGTLKGGGAQDVTYPIW